MEEFKIADIKNILKEDSFGQNRNDSEKEKIISKVKDFFKTKKEKKAVLGLDIYQYSKYKDEKQDLIPVILKELIDKAFNDFKKYEPESYKRNKTVLADFIDTGDGGYWFFDTPLDALIFSMYINLTVHAFNSFILYPMLREHIGIFTIRFAITYDEIYKLDGKNYGTAIINNARIMSKDKLNRLLIDENSYDWFLKEINGVENIKNFNVVNQQKNNRITTLKNHNYAINDQLDFLKNKYENSLVLGVQKDSEFKNQLNHENWNTEYLDVITNVICQKLDQISVKEDNFKVYNLFIQYLLTIDNDEDVTPSAYYTEVLSVSLGNLNTNGI